MRFSSFLCCPVCGGMLSRTDGSLFCDAHTGRRHCYDVASSGYVNLLPPGKGSNARTGDDAAMITARTAFLSGGYYNCISDAAADVAARFLMGTTSVQLCDAGSGEGYHTCRIACGIADKLKCRVDMCGIEASKKGAANGAKLAAGMPQEVNVSFAAGNIFALPIADGELHGMFSLFAPIPAAEAARTLRDDGYLFVVAAAPRHLWELRCVLYDEPREGNSEVKTPDGFSLLCKESIVQTIHIPTSDALMSLFVMTPFYYRTPQAGKERLEKTESLDVTVAVDIYVYRKTLSERK